MNSREEKHYYVFSICILYNKEVVGFSLQPFIVINYHIVTTTLVTFVRNNHLKVESYKISKF